MRTKLRQDRQCLENCGCEGEKGGSRAGFGWRVFGKRWHRLEHALVNVAGEKAAAPGGDRAQTKRQG